MRGLVIWARIRSVLFLLLYLSLVATALSMVARYFPAAGEASATVGFLARLTGTFTGVLTLAVVLVTRHLGQLEINVLGCLLHATPPRDGGSAVVDHEKAPHS